MRAIELFAGIGGFRLGLERAGHSVVWANEWDKYACDVYDQNFKGGRIDRRDVTTIPASDVPEHDLIIGGFPCQAFSVAGKRGGFADIRGTLFFDIARIAKHHKTPYLLLENVRGLLSHNSGRTFGTIVATLDELGYDLQWQVLNSKDFGVPQNRERVLIVGHLRSFPRPEVFPLGAADSQDHQPQSDEQPRAQGIATRHLDRNGGLISPLASTLQVAEVPHIISSGHEHQKDRYYDASGVSPAVQARTNGRGGVGAHIKVLTEPGTSVAERVYDPSGIAQTLIARGGGGGAKTGLYEVGPKVVQRPRGNNAGGEHDIAPTPTGRSYQDNNHVTVPKIRRLTPLECERLQAFPDNWTKTGFRPDGTEYLISDSQRYKMCGNAVTTNVIEAVASHLPIQIPS